MPYFKIVCLSIAVGIVMKKHVMYEKYFVINSPCNVGAPSRINDSLEFDGK